MEAEMNWIEDKDFQSTEDASLLRGPIMRPDGKLCIGKVGAPPPQEATSDRFHFWVPEDALVEKTQIVTCESKIAGQDITFYAIVDEVLRQSGKRDMGSEVSEADGDLSYEPPFGSDGFTYASASILRTEPPALTPPRERSDVLATIHCWSCRSSST